jgi:hypothetical protein
MAGFGGKAKIVGYINMLLVISKRKIVPVGIKGDEISTYFELYIVNNSIQFNSIQIYLCAET